MNNVEIKAKVTKPHQDAIRKLLMANGIPPTVGRGVKLAGTDHQIDTYFNVPEGKGRLKLREGQIENSLILYQRDDKPGPKTSNYWLTRLDPFKAETLKHTLSWCYGVKVVVDKKREIYFLDNVKIHLDEVKGLGLFVEIECRNEDWGISHCRLCEQCDGLIKEFKLDDSHMVAQSYSDMILHLQSVMEVVNRGDPVA